MLNKVLLIGNLTRDPEVKFTPKGTAIGELGLAINRKFTVDGEKREETTFVDVTMFGKTAELAGKYLSKGRSALIEGRLQLDQWEDKQTGAKRSKLKVVADSIQFLGGKPGQDGQTASKPARQASAAPQGQAGGDDEEGSDRIPF